MRTIREDTPKRFISLGEKLCTFRNTSFRISLVTAVEIFDPHHPRRMLPRAPTVATVKRIPPI